VKLLMEMHYTYTHNSLWNNLYVDYKIGDRAEF